MEVTVEELRDAVPGDMPPFNGDEETLSWNQSSGPTGKPVPSMESPLPWFSHQLWLAQSPLPISAKV